VIFLIAYLTGYVFCFPKVMLWWLSIESRKPYDAEDVVFAISMSTMITTLYPAIILGLMFDHFIIQPLTENLNRSE